MESAILARSGDCNIKILKMDRQPYPDETHDYNEALIVVMACCCACRSRARQSR